MGAHVQMTADKTSESIVVDRYTRSGRRLFYRLEVIQQPERARACGSGPKSSADRRPVDPPPVVELRIFEGPDFAQAKDITFNYNANFFLFATLEHARLIAHGRVQTPATNTPPVLTGMPVSGMAYLDRPQEAGYFLFPDLSVRHEGRYRLTFNLYEETKEDRDKEPETVDVAGNSNAFAGGSFDWRMEVKSADFTVFSAKKFPGLAESTSLSRTVAEQGCRVRIRRDVRMRRRDGKAGGEMENNGNEDFARRRRTQTPEVEKEFRARSASNSSERTPYNQDSSRRPSGAEYPPPPPPPPPPPGFSSSQPPSTSHLSFGGAYPNPPQYPSQTTSSRHASPVPRSPSYSGGQSSYQLAHSAYPPAPHSQPQTPVHSERPPSQQYSYPNPSPRREEFPADLRRMSTTSQHARPNTPQSATDRDFGSRGWPYPAGQPQHQPPQQAPRPPSRISIEPRDNGSANGNGYKLQLPSIASLIGDVSGTSNPLPSPTSDKDHRSSITMVDTTVPAVPTSRKRLHSEANPSYLARHESKNGKRPEETLMTQRIQARSELLEERMAAQGIQQFPADRMMSQPIHQQYPSNIIQHAPMPMNQHQIDEPIESKVMVYEGANYQTKSDLFVKWA